MTVHIEWGMQADASEFDVTVIVDCLSFSTATTVACRQGAHVVPSPSRERGEILAKEIGALCAGRRREGGYSLSPPTLAGLQTGETLVLPSLNGSRLSSVPRDCRVFVGCMRNAPALGRYLALNQFSVLLLAAGEIWEDGSLRPALEDQFACGAIADAIGGNLTPEAQMARSGYLAHRHEANDLLRGSVSGQELLADGFEQDIFWASQLGAQDTIPELIPHNGYSYFRDVHW